MTEQYRYQPRTGGCQCGAIRFSATQLHDNPHVCHCRMCQKAVGNLFASLVGVEAEHLTWTRGKPAEFMSSDLAARGFCRNCGTPLYYRFVDSTRVALTIGAFDEPASIPLLFEFGLEAKHPSLGAIDGAFNAGTTEESMSGEVAAIVASNHQHPDHDTTSWPE